MLSSFEANTGSLTLITFGLGVSRTFWLLLQAGRRGAAAEMESAGKSITCAVSRLPAAMECQPSSAAELTDEARRAPPTGSAPWLKVCSRQAPPSQVHMLLNKQCAFFGNLFHNDLFFTSWRRVWRLQVKSFHREL